MEGGWEGREVEGGRDGWREGGRGREGGREGWNYNRCVHIHSMHFIVGPMPSEIGTRISLTRYLLYIYSSSTPSFYFLIGKPSENGAYSHGASLR